MLLKRTGKDGIEVRGYGSAEHGEILELPDKVAELQLAMSGWEKTESGPKAAPVKRTTPNPTMEGGE